VSAPYAHVHRVRFEEVDAAGIVYFARFFSICHDAMAGMLASLDGGYEGLVMERRLGLPAVHVEADFAAPLRFGDEVRIAAVVERMRESSVALRFDLERVSREGTAEGAHVATIRHIVALTSLAAMRAEPLPDDVRAAFEAYRVTPADS
jgi:4-hydroxybenzoyl-CoA thioesterase